MKPIVDEKEEGEIEKKENQFYKLFLDKAVQYANKKYDGTDFRQLVAAAGVVARTKQSRSATRVLVYQIERDTARGLLADHAEIIKEIPAKTR